MSYNLRRKTHRLACGYVNDASIGFKNIYKNKFNVSIFVRDDSANIETGVHCLCRSLDSDEALRFCKAVMSQVNDWKNKDSFEKEFRYVLADCDDATFQRFESIFKHCKHYHKHEDE